MGISRFLSEIQQTELVGGAGGFPFELVSPQRQPVVGFRYAIGSWAGKKALSQFEPIFERDPSATTSGNIVLAKDGYVVGGLDVDAESLVHGVRVHFVRQTESGERQKSDSYTSEWIGQPTGDDIRTIGRSSQTVVGIRGRRGAVIDAIGLILE